MLAKECFVDFGVIMFDMLAQESIVAEQLAAPSYGAAETLAGLGFNRDFGQAS